MVSGEVECCVWHWAAVAAEGRCGGEGLGKLVCACTSPAATLQPLSLEPAVLLPLRSPTVHSQHPLTLSNPNSVALLLLSLLPPSHRAYSSPESQTESRWLAVYGALVGVVCVLSLARASLFFMATLRTATRLHGAMVEHVLRAPLSFFHTNPSGRVLNRCAWLHLGVRGGCCLKLA